MSDTTIGKYLCKRLKDAGCDHLFAVPGDFVLGFLNDVLESDLEYVGTCNELNAAYAADAYARHKGIAAFATTYAVGELSAINGVAGSLAENVPVVVITGGPATSHYQLQTPLHHTLGDYDIPLEMYSKITKYKTALSNPATAARDINKAIDTCLHHSLPVYIVVPSDMVKQPIRVSGSPFVKTPIPKSVPGSLEEAVLDTLRLLHGALKPVIMSGMLLHRYGLKDDFQTFVEASGLPFASMMLSKALVDEDHPQYIGLYCGGRSRSAVKDRVENADLVLIFGAKFTDFTTGGFTANLDPRRTVFVGRDHVRISYHTYNDVQMGDYISALSSRILVQRRKDSLDYIPASQSCVHRPNQIYEPQPDTPLTMARFFNRMAHFIEENSIVIAETGASLFSASETMMPKKTTYIGQTFYGSIGYTVGATLGSCIACPDRKVVLFIGDGSFQVTCQDLSTMIRYGCKPIIFLINNDGYTIERVIVDRIYNDIQPWKYHQLCDVFGGGKTFNVKNEVELEQALVEAKTIDDLIFIELHTDRWDCNESLKEAGRVMAEINKLL